MYVKTFKYKQEPYFTTEFAAKIIITIRKRPLTPLLSVTSKSITKPYHYTIFIITVPAMTEPTTFLTFTNTTFSTTTCPITIFVTTTLKTTPTKTTTTTMITR